MSNLLELKDIIYGYEINSMEHSEGVVIAENIKDAKEKVIQAHIKWGYKKNEIDNIDVWRINKEAGYVFTNDVLQMRG